VLEAVKPVSRVELGNGCDKSKEFIQDRVWNENRRQVLLVLGNYLVERSKFNHLLAFINDD